MDRENFYLLLNLPLDPPEKDSKKIEAAINLMRATWSRYRNHPSKGIQAKKFIGMIPEIRKVMGDPLLRKKEAELALDLLKQKKKEKFAQVDRHLQLRMSKGFISEKEINKLAELHKLSEDAITDRIRELKEEKRSAIDDNIRLRMAKGYITEADIASIAKLHGVNAEEVRKRVKGPIKEVSEHDVETAPRLDRSIAENIATNLNIVGKADLYAFLESGPTQSSKQLLAKAKLKETELQNIGKKDAVVTASSALVGHCVSIFKSEELRRGYDMILARSHLTELNSDIDVAGMDGKIRTEYFEILVERGIEFGMDRGETAQYIRDYCQKKNWTVEEPPVPHTVAKKPRKVPALLLLIVILVGGGTYYWYQKSNQAKREFEQLETQAAQTADLKQRAGLYQTYISSHPNGEFTEQIEQRLSATRAEMQKIAFETMVQEAAQAETTSLAAAVEIYEAYLKKTPNGSFTKHARQKIEALNNQIDERDYEQALVPQDTVAKIDAFQTYLATHPQGKFVPEIKKRLIAMSQEFYLHTSKEIKIAQQNEDWKHCLALVQGYLDVYAENRHTEELKAMLDDFTVRLRDSRAFASVLAISQQHGTNYYDARQELKDYLSAYPDTTVKKKVETEINRINNLMDQARIDAELEHVRNKLVSVQEKFAEETTGILKDSERGLMWTLLDSKQQTTQCHTYSEAEAYVEALQTGGYSDWRLPSLQELNDLLKDTGLGPADNDDWFWTKEKYTRYSDGWITEVRTLESRGETHWAESKHDARDCGSVRPVRP